jgi:hypothetical protein
MPEQPASIGENRLREVRKQENFSAAPLGTRIAQPVSTATGGRLIRARFLRNIRLGDIRRAWLQHKSQGLRPSLKVVQDTLLVAIFII